MEHQNENAEKDYKYFPGNITLCSIRYQYELGILFQLMPQPPSVPLQQHLQLALQECIPSAKKIQITPSIQKQDYEDKPYPTTALAEAYNHAKWSRTLVQ